MFIIIMVIIRRATGKCYILFVYILHFAGRLSEGNGQRVSVVD